MYRRTFFDGTSVKNPLSCHQVVVSQPGVLQNGCRFGLRELGAWVGCAHEAYVFTGGALVIGPGDDGGLAVPSGDLRRRRMAIP